MKKITLVLFASIYSLNTIAMLPIVDKNRSQLNCIFFTKKYSFPHLKKETKKVEPLIAPTFCAIFEQNIFTIPILCARYERVEEIVSLVRALVRTNKFLKKFINDKKRTLQLIKQLRPHFVGYSHLYIAQLLGTKAARDRFIVQKAFLEGWVDHYRCPFAEHSKILQTRELDLEFTSGYCWETPLLKALWRQYPNIAIWLIDNGADITVHDPCKTNACMMALAIHWKPLTEKILNHPRFDVHYSDNAKNTPLHYCFFKFQEDGIARYDQDAWRRYWMDEIIEKLLQKGADPTAINGDGKTPLDFAKVNRDGKTPLDFAKESGDKRIIDLMEKAAANLLINKKTS